MLEDTSGQDTLVVRQSKLSQLKKHPIKVVLIATSMIAAAWFAYPAIVQWSGASLTIDASRLRIDVVERGLFVKDLSVQGRVVAASRPMLFARESGRVTLFVRAGDVVSEGDVLAEIESPSLVNSYQQEQATLAQMKTELSRQLIDLRVAKFSLEEQHALAKAHLVSATRGLDRAAIALENKIISTQDYEASEDVKNEAETVFVHKEKSLDMKIERLRLDKKILEISLNRQELKVEELERQIAGLKILSPVTGIVGNLEIEQKSVVSKDQAIMTVVDMSQFEIESNTPEIYANDLVSGMKVEIDYSGSKYSGELSAISPEVENGQVNTRVKFIGSPPENIRQNQKVTTRIIFDSRDDVLMVDAGPFLQDGDRGYVYTIVDQVAVKTPIRFGSFSVGRVEILSGVEEGTRIIISSNDVFKGHDRILLNNL